MHVIPSPPAEIRLVFRSGLYLSFPSLHAAAHEAQARRWLGRWASCDPGLIGNDFGAAQRVLTTRSGERIAFEWTAQAPNIVVRTAIGDPIDVEDLRDALRPSRPDRHYGTHRFRREPVPGVRRARGYRWCRHPRTQRELREQLAYREDLREYGLDERKVGRVRDVPTAWDDRARHCERSWKRQRRTRWKAHGRDFGGSRSTSCRRHR